MKKLSLRLPLPPSKNKRMSSVTYFCKKRRKHVNRMLVSKEVTAYRTIVNSIFAKMNIGAIGFVDKQETIIQFDWYIPNMRRDVINFHQDLCDCLQSAIGVNDRYFLLHDRSRTVDRNSEYVIVNIYQ